MVEFFPTVNVFSEEEFKERAKVVHVLLADVQVPMAQIDIFDGLFVDGKPTFTSPEYVSALDDPFPFEVDLMVKDPLSQVQRWVEAGAKRILFHIEAVDDVAAAIKRVKDAGVDVGLSLNPETSVEDVLPFVNDIDVVLLMGVHPGASGQAFLPETVERVRSLREREPGILIEIDGGVHPGTAGDLVAAGANRLAVGSYFDKEDPLVALEELKNDVRN